MESMNDPPEMIVYENLKQLIKYRNIETNYEFLTKENFSTVMNTYKYIHIEGIVRKNKNIKQNNKKNQNEQEKTSKESELQIHIFLIKPDSDYEKKTNDFENLIKRFIGNINKDKQFDKNNLEIIFITHQTVSTYINKKIIEFNNTFTINAYTYEFFIIVTPENESAFKHEVATEDEISAYTSRLLITVDMLPKIHYKDPQLVWIGAKKGDVIKITGISETAQEIEELRLVI